MARTQPTLAVDSVLRSLVFCGAGYWHHEQRAAMVVRIGDVADISDHGPPRIAGDFLLPREERFQHRRR